MSALNKEQLGFFYNEIMGLLGWGDEQESELTDIDPLIWAKSEMKNKDERAIHYALILEQFQELLGVYTTTAAFEKIAELRAELNGERLINRGLLANEMEIRADNGELHRLLAIYGDHTAVCCTRFGGNNKPCNCGWNDFLTDGDDHIVDADEMPPIVHFLTHPEEYRSDTENG